MLTKQDCTDVSVCAQRGSNKEFRGSSYKQIQKGESDETVLLALHKDKLLSSISTLSFPCVSAPTQQLEMMGCLTQLSRV